MFGHEDGLLRAATGTSGQPDVWGTAFAVAHGFLSPTVERRACAALARGCRDADLAWKGQIRQVPPQADVNPGQPWERLIQPAPEASAQNGAYSAMATGWVCDAVYRADPDLAGRLVQQLVNHFREEDFRNGESSGAPWGWAHPRGDYRNERGYLAAMTGPLISFFRNGWMSASEEMTE